jgi:hypothetical protein
VFNIIPRMQNLVLTISYTLRIAKQAPHICWK